MIRYLFLVKLLLHCDWVFWLTLVIFTTSVVMVTYTAKNYENDNLSTKNLWWLLDFTNCSIVIFYLIAFFLISWLPGIFGLIVKFNTLIVLYILTKVLWPLYIDKMLEDKWKFLVLFSLFIIFIYTCILFWVDIYVGTDGDLTNAGMAIIVIMGYDRNLNVWLEMWF